MNKTLPDVKAEGRYNAKQTANLLGISRQTLRAWVKRGWIRAHKGRNSSRPWYVGSEIQQLWRETFY